MLEADTGVVGVNGVVAHGPVKCPVLRTYSLL